MISSIYIVISCLGAFIFYLNSFGEVRYFLEAQEVWLLSKSLGVFSVLLIAFGVFTGLLSSQRKVKIFTVFWGVLCTIFSVLWVTGWEAGYEFLSWSFLILPIVLASYSFFEAFTKHEVVSDEKLSEWVWSTGTFFISCQITLCIQALLVVDHLSIDTSETIAVVAKLSTYLCLPLAVIILLFAGIIWYCIKNSRFRICMG